MGDLRAEAVRLVWKSGTPAVAEVVPLWSDTPLAGLHVDADRTDVVRGTASSFVVDISAERGADVTGNLSVAPPAGWTADPASTPVTVKRGFTQSVTVKLTPPADAALADVDIPVTFTSGTTTFEAVLRVAVRPRTGTANVALDHPAVASSIEPGTSFTADLAVDGDTDHALGIRLRRRLVAPGRPRYVDAPRQARAAVGGGVRLGVPGAGLG